MAEYIVTVQRTIVEQSDFVIEVADDEDPWEVAEDALEDSDLIWEEVDPRTPEAMGEVVAVEPN